jgi:prolipoprotein diacylglyceryltransferase
LIARSDAPLAVVPVQAIEAAGLFAIAAWAAARLQSGRIAVFAPALVAYSVLRFALEWLRDDPERNFLGPLSTSQWIAAAVVAGVLIGTRLTALAAPPRADRARPTPPGGEAGADAA